MVEAKKQFNDRLNFLGRKHQAMSRRYTTQMRTDGLIVVKPRRRSIDIPFQGILLLLLGFVFFKAFMLASIGPDTYCERVAILNSGIFVEQGGAWVMQTDPVSQVIANYMGPISR
ncbi:MAG: hypothetical protein ACI9PU_000517 [Ascidiaceihabitans sp.]|jgi:hypothetical protein|tara:strand:+ start:450 stop:794 length:345 start_codon:yes stop_codon:yes gene_type:complete